MQRNAETRIECALDHAFAVYLQNTRGSKATHQRFTHLGRIGTRFGGKDQRFGDSFNIERDDNLVCDLGGLAITAIAHKRDVLAHQFQQRQCGIKTCLCTACHDGKARVLRTDLAA
ncbi:hypothetical protein D9M72_589960 [compost metagenome]